MFIKQSSRFSRGLFRYQRLTASMTTKDAINTAQIDYTKWSKKQLIEKIRKLEGGDDQIHENNLTIDKETVIKSDPPKKKKEFDFSKFTTRHIALRFSYLGWNYLGLAIQSDEKDDAIHSVEYEIVKALNRVKLVPNYQPQDFKFSRCGRTDKGVSAMNQVISLEVRSNLTKEELDAPENDIKEIDYVNKLNQALPADIRFHSVCLRPPKDFDARFSCTYRHYKYIFNGKDLNTKKMNEAASYFIGENDFRNFCKIDASKQITNFNRRILKSEISKLEDDSEFFVFNLRGSAFLWHQVRCMVAVLLAVGQELEDPTIVARLLDINEFPSRPIYNMAHDIPLILYDCGFNKDDVKWSSGPTRESTHHMELDGLWNDYSIKSIVSNFMKNTVYSNMPPNFDKVVMNLGDGKGKTTNKYIPFDKRRKLETSEEINAKWLSKKRKRGDIE